MKVIVSDNVSDTLRSLTEAMIQILESIHIRDMYLAISGGETAQMLLDMWSSDYSDSIDWSRIQLFWVDERCVPAENPQSNYGMTVQHLLGRIDIPAKNVHRIRGEAHPQTEAMRYSTLTKKLLPWKDDEPMFDLVILGMGADGHVASIFTKTDSQDLVAGYKVTIHPQSGQLRVGMSIPLINNAMNVFLLAYGTEKKIMLKNLINSDFKQFYPIEMVKPCHSQLLLFTDKETIA